VVTAAKQRQLARELGTRVRYLRLTGLDDAALVAAMSDRMADIQALLDAAGPSGMDALPQRLPDLRRLVALLTGMAAGGAQYGAEPPPAQGHLSATWGSKPPR